jgi:dihydropteroate synthase
MTTHAVYNPRILTFTRQQDLIDEIASIESYPEGIERTTRKGSMRLVRVSNLEAHPAMLLKQHMLAMGGDALISPAVYLGEQPSGTTDALIFASLRQLHDLIALFRRLPLPALQTLAAELEAALSAYETPTRPTMTIAGRGFAWGSRTYVMASHSVAVKTGDRPLMADESASAHEWARHAVNGGVDMLDIGVTWHARISSPREECAALVPVIKRLRDELSIPIAIRSWRAETVADALVAGAHLVNDRMGLRMPDGSWNEPLVSLVADLSVPLVITGVSSGTAAEGNALLHEMSSDLRGSIDYALEHGIRRDQLIIDPGIGQARTAAQNVTLLRRLAELRSLGLPLLVDTSSSALLAPDSELNSYEMGVQVTQDAFLVLAIQNGADMVQMHDWEVGLRLAQATDVLTRTPNTHA